MSSSSSSSSSSSMNRYWIPYLDIHRKVITQELQFHLGPQATVRPYTLQGEDGFLISTPGACLTDEQIDDICRKSKQLWERQAAAKIRENPSKSLKRPLHQPIVISNSQGGRKRRSLPPPPLTGAQAVGVSIAASAAASVE
ncbi:hypothetical protein L249_5105 [Ophiocordyceps polyrhachis-furcata BCC 54312]|uniref:Uncharacterized protein n=1 Tax=Ophiocordyceps polyrhachis-furcata BCC 54312 TaxID=1330021 RepID=A0A367L3R5_9HYPO|nr:hypothetical protein L249_5105 [Ophiocordyceps polyrhachis-furcata BCC 54312]